MNKSLTVIDINPIPVAIVTCPGLFTQYEKEAIKNIEIITNSNSNLSSFAISKSYNILNDMSLHRLQKLFDSCVEEYVKKILELDMSFKCIGSWVTKNSKGSSHHNHFHPNSLISTVAYFSEDEENPGLNFETKGLSNVFQTNLFKFQNLYDDKSNKYNSFSVNVTPGQEGVIVFPSHLYHQGIPAIRMKDIW